MTLTTQAQPEAYVHKGQSSRWARVLPQRRNRIPFLLGLVLAPIFIFLQEAAHFAVARALGFKATGLPIWLGLTLLAMVAACLVVETFRLHPPGSRLVPFMYGFLGGVLGMELWLHGLGPRLLS